MEDDKSGTSGEANWQKEMDLDWAHITRQALTWNPPGKQYGLLIIVLKWFSFMSIMKNSAIAFQSPEQGELFMGLATPSHKKTFSVTEANTREENIKGYYS